MLGLSISVLSALVTCDASATWLVIKLYLFNEVNMGGGGGLITVKWVLLYVSYQWNLYMEV